MMESYCLWCELTFGSTCTLGGSGRWTVCVRVCVCVHVHMNVCYM